MNNTKILDSLYRSEINYTIQTDWDAGITVKLGDSYNGYIDEATFPHIQEGLLWLKDKAIHHFPDSEFSKKASRL